MADRNVIEIDISDAIRGMDKVADKARNTKKLMQNITGHLLAGVDQNMADERGPDGPWVPLDPKTIKKRERGTKNHRPSWPGKILDRKTQGGLAAAFFGHSSRDEAEVGNPKIYAPIQFLGGVAGRNHSVEIPARNPLWINPATDREIDAEVDDWFDD